MKKVLLPASIALLCACATTQKTHDDAPDVELDVTGFQEPESVLHDARADVYLVSNVAGHPFLKDGTGFISRVAPDGKVLDLQWIAGLDAPKGLAIHEDLLAVSDITVLRRYRRDTGAVHDVIELPGATCLNDVVAAPDGSFFVTDMGMRADGDGFAPTGSDAIYRVASNGEVTRIAHGSELSMPNGLAVQNSELLMVPFGAPKLQRYSFEGALLGEIALPSGQLDGLVALPDGCVLASSLESASLLFGRPASGLSEAHKQLAMDIGYDAKRARVLLPVMPEGRIRTLSARSLSSLCK